MKTRNKAILTAVCAVLLVVMSVMGTMAYLTDKDAVVNTFTVGKVGLSLDEAKVDKLGNLLNKDGDIYVEGDELAERVKENVYHLLPGHTYVKDPTVTVDAGSEECFVRMFVKVENMEALTGPLAGKDGFWQGDLFLLQALCGGWDQSVWACVGLVDNTNNIYEFRYKEAVAKSADATTLPALFTSITLPGEYFGNDDMVSVEADEEAGTEAKVGLDAVAIKVYAQAMQADGFEDDVEGAWTAAGMPQFN
ncbi:MAG: hypothetical protein E7218_01180 [Anaerofustis stercorihominis]|nr:hypothetical protein [Anaerofustis stercorihominis]